MSFESIKEEFGKSHKRILKRKLSTVPDTIQKYKTDIITQYNLGVDYLKLRFEHYTSAEKDQAEKEYDYYKTKLKLCLDRLGCEYKYSGVFLEIINSNEVTDPKPKAETEELGDSESTPSSESSDDENMAISIIELIRLCGETIPNPFNGDPLQLQAFLNAIDLLTTIAEDKQETLVAFIKTRLTGKALENLHTSDDTAQKIKTRLSDSIKPENDKIIRGKMAALKADHKSLTDFTKQADSLADSLKRALILEGIPSTKANSMVIDETIAMCKNSARSDYVKSVLASSSYSNAKEVVAKFVVEIANDKSDKQVLAYQTMRRQNGLNQRRGRHNGGFRPNNQNNNGRRFGNSGSRPNNGFRHNGQNNSYRGNNWRNGNSHFNNQRRQNGNYAATTQGNVRAIMGGPENSPGPQQQNLGANRRNPQDL